jgi:PEP-CTERM motif-containing protein
MRLGRVCCSLVLLVLSVLIPFAGGADAVPFSILPNGDLVIETTYTTQGTFQCPGGFHDLAGVTCTGSGTNAITVGIGTNRAAVTFFGASTTVPLNAGVGAQVPLGVIFASATPGFTFPIVHPQEPLVIFNLSLRQSSPAAGESRFRGGFGLNGGGTELPFEAAIGPEHMQLPIGSPPPGYNYGALIYSVDRFSIPSQGVVDVEARLGAIPEPTTMLLVGTTLAGLGLARWRKLKQAARAH